MKAYQRIDKKLEAYKYFLTNSWIFRDDNVKAMISRMTENDRAIFNCDLSTVDTDAHAQVWCIGLRRYILKHDLKDTVKSENKQKLLCLANMVFLVVYGYGLWFVVSTILSIACYLFRFFV